MVHYHAVTPDDAVRILGTNRNAGLLRREAVRRLKKYGPNRIERHRKIGLLSVFVSQFSDVMVITLLVATIISALMGELVDAAVISIIVILNAILGTFQEFRAEKSLEALESYAPPLALAIRNGSPKEVDSETVVPGDLLVIKPGVRMAADVRLLEATSLQMEEAALTGESMPVSKNAALTLPSNSVVAERKNMAYGGTLCIRGEGLGVVVAVGMNTEMGQIAKLVSSAKAQKTPLEARLESLGKAILAGCIAICVVLAGACLLRGLPFRQMFLISVSMAVAAVPEGMPAVVTLCLALGVQRMAKRGAVVRRLEAIETLGSVTVICTDKTGTLTKNEMAVAKVAVLSPKSAAVEDFSVPWRFGPVRELLKWALLASDARHFPEKSGAAGEDPTEQAIVKAAVAAGWDLNSVDANFPRCAEKAFTSERRMMSVKVSSKNVGLVCAKGAPDKLFPLCARQKSGEMTAPFNRQVWERWVDDQAGMGMRVLAVAVKDERSPISGEYQEYGFTLVGCLALEDPLRPDIREAVQRCKRAGIRPVLVTGDHLRTAESIAKQSGIFGENSRGLTGADLEEALGQGSKEKVLETNVFARVSPGHKLSIVKAFKSMGQIVAMTGDGVNDAPALKEAAVGISMGLSGTDVAREASSMVLLDDDFSTIVKAIEEGRAIYDNIRKFIRYMFSCNLGEVLAMVGAVALGLPIPLSPTQLLWVNLVTDGLPALALSMDAPEKGIMERRPRHPKESVFSGGLARKILARGFYIGSVTLLMFIWGLESGDMAQASTLALATIVGTQLVAAFDCRSETKTPLQTGLLSNMYLVGATLLSCLMLFAAIQFGPMARFFKTVPLHTSQWIMVAMAALIPDLFRNAISR